MHDDFDIFVSGGGIAGLLTAAAFGHAGFSVLLADPVQPDSDSNSTGSDLRSTAFLQPACALFEQISLWNELADHAQPLDALRIVDSIGWPPEIAETRVFEASDLGETSFGWNLPNSLIHKKLKDFIARQPGIEILFGSGFKSMLTRTREALVSLDNQRRIRARLVVAADGCASPVREVIGIGVQTIRYSQRALAFSATHAMAHGNISTEIYNQGGAFTTVPLPDRDGVPSSAIVWMNQGPKAQSLANLPKTEFDTAMAQRACNLLGPMARVGGLRSWPVITQRADHMIGERTALVAEAAHVLPPIGAQGLNTSLHDIASLYDLAINAPDQLGSANQLAVYAKRREGDIAHRARAIDLFNRICKSGIPAIQALRRAGLKTAHDVSPLRNSIMRAGLGRR